MTILIKDNSLINEYEAHSIIQKLINKDISTLEAERFIVFPPKVSDSEDLDGKNYIFENRNGNTWTCNVIGFLKKGLEEVRITSRFYQSDKQKDDYFIWYMLEKVTHYNVISSKVNMDNKQSFFDLLPFLFHLYLNSAMKKGVYKEYIEKKYNDSNVKGTIDVSRHIKNNVPFIGNIAYVTREFSYDNKVTQLIRHTIEKLQMDDNFNFESEKLSSENIRVINDITSSYSKLNKEIVLQENIDKPLKHGYFEEYSFLQKLCIMILKGEEVNFGEDEDEVNGIIIDVAWLWEEYISMLLRDYSHLSHNESLYVSGNRGQVRPDFYHKEHGIVLDTKYKKLNKGIKREDRFQIISYLHYKNANKGGFIYPFQETNYELEGMLKGMGGEIFKLSLAIPQNEDDYEMFKEKIIANELEMLSKLRILE